MLNSKQRSNLKSIAANLSPVGQVGKGGIVRDPQVHREVLLGVIAAAPGMGFAPLGLAVSPIRGAEGNVEFLLHLRAGAAEPFDAEGAVETALQAVDSV